MPKTIYLVRHGETDFNTDPVPRVRGRIPVPLNETGLRHANQAEQKITDIHLIAGSPELRIKNLHFPVVILNGLYYITHSDRLSRN